MKPIGTVRTGFIEKFSTPRQPGLVDTRAVVEIDPEFQPELSVSGLENYSHLWLIFHFHQLGDYKYSPKIRPPRLSGEKAGVFSTRSPHRPNPIGLSLVKIVAIEAGKIIVSGADLVDQTPIFDIKPYLPEIESVEASYDRRFHRPLLEVIWRCDPPRDRKTVLEQLVRLDPRPQSSRNEEKKTEFAMSYYDDNVVFQVRGQVAEIIRVEKLST